MQKGIAVGSHQTQIMKANLSLAEILLNSPAVHEYYCSTILYVCSSRELSRRVVPDTCIGTKVIVNENE